MRRILFGSIAVGLFLALIHTNARAEASLNEKLRNALLQSLRNTPQSQNGASSLIYPEDYGLSLTREGHKVILSVDIGPTQPHFTRRGEGVLWVAEQLEKGQLAHLLHEERLTVRFQSEALLLETRIEANRENFTMFRVRTHTDGGYVRKEVHVQDELLLENLRNRIADSVERTIQLRLNAAFKTERLTRSKMYILQLQVSYDLITSLSSFLGADKTLSLLNKQVVEVIEKYHGGNYQHPEIDRTIEAISRNTRRFFCNKQFWR